MGTIRMGKTFKGQLEKARACAKPISWVGKAHAESMIPFVKVYGTISSKEIVQFTRFKTVLAPSVSGAFEKDITKIGGDLNRALKKCAHDGR